MRERTLAGANLETEESSSNSHAEPNDWTIMFFFASDNPLAPLLVSQLKAIKDAGFQEHTGVLVYFDPMEKGYPTKIYNVNHKRKADAKKKWEKDKKYAKTKIGDANDSFVRKMKGDEIDPGNFSQEMQEAMRNPSTPAHEALGYFVDHGLKKHSARNYMLILIGHGMMVGRDMFLPDQDPVSAITLQQLKVIMEKFVENGKTRLQLLALHSCSMSSIEVAYELRRTANYMIAHQGPAFVNSWPYRQLLKKVFNTIEKKKRAAEERARKNEQDEEGIAQAIKDAQINVENLVEKLYFHCLHNATDFLSAGYSADLALCSLQEATLERIKEPLQILVRKLKANLYPRSIVKDLILLAHWESQSFWEENYTDLNDFCRCLIKGCNERASILKSVSSAENELVKELGEVAAACQILKGILDEKKWEERFDGLVIHEDHFGSKYQFASGLSVYFPWCEPLDDEPVPSSQKRILPRPGQTQPVGRHLSVINRYKDYDFTTMFGDDSWWSFLELYFAETKRKDENLGTLDDVMLEAAKLEFNSGGTLGSRTPEVGTRTPETGAPCECPTIKNYPTESDKKDTTRKIKKFSITPGALLAFRPDQELVEEDTDDEGMTGAEG